MFIKSDTGKSWLPLYEALASEVRLSILDLLAERERNVKELAGELGLSSAIVTMHIRKLEEGGLIRTKMIRRDGGTHKMCSLAAAGVEMTIPKQRELLQSRTFHEVSIPVGHYTEFDVYPTCGLATREKVIGQYDDPRYFHEPERMFAQILWFGKGYVEYKLPNYLMAGQQPTEIEISLELGSEAPGANDNWPSDIHFYLNGVCLGMWTSPGDFGSTIGKHSPAWWQRAGINQHGLLKVLRITPSGATIDGQTLSGVSLHDIGLERNQWTLRLAVQEDSRNVGGMTLYGAGFGNYDQDIQFRVYYE